MAINIDALIQHLMEDPDIIPPKGENKKDIARALATQRAKQAANNTKALNMAKSYSNVEQLLTFLKAEEDDPDFEQEYYRHEKNFTDLRDRVEKARIKGLDEPAWGRIKTGDRKGELSAKGAIDKKNWDEAFAFMQQHMPSLLQEHYNKIIDGLGGETQDAEDIDPDEEIGDEGDVEDKGSSASQREGEIADDVFPGLEPGERERRASMSLEERQADARARAAAMADMEEDEGDATSNAVADKLAEVDDTPSKPETYFTEGKFNPLQSREYNKLLVDHNEDFLDAALDWYTRPSSDRGGEGGDGIPGHGQKHPSVLHANNKIEGHLDIASIRAMANQYADAVEKHHGRGQEHIESSTPKGKRTLEEWSGKKAVDQVYADKMNTILNRILDGYAPPNEESSPQQKSRRTTVRNNNPEAAEAFDKMREDWEAQDLRGKLDREEITPDEYHDELEKFLRDNADTHNKHYKDADNHIGGKKNRIPKRPESSELPADDVQDNLIEAATGENSEEDLSNAIADEIDNIVSGDDTPKTKQRATETLSDFVEELIEQTDNELELPDLDAVNREIAHATAQGVNTGDSSSEELNDAIEDLPDGEAESILQTVSPTNRPMSANAKLHLQQNDIDPDGEGLEHIKNIRDAKAHVEQHKAEVAQAEEADAPKSLKDRVADAARQAGEEVEKVKAELATATENRAAAQAEYDAAVEEAYEDIDVDWDNLNEEERNSVTDNGGIMSGGEFIDAPPHIQERHGFTDESGAEEPAAVEPPARRARGVAKKLQEAGFSPEKLAHIKTHAEADEHISNNPQMQIEGGEGSETPPETPTDESQSQSEEGTTEDSTGTSTDEGTQEGDGELVDDESSEEDGGLDEDEEGGAGLGGGELGDEDELGDKDELGGGELGDNEDDLGGDGDTGGGLGDEDGDTGGDDDELGGGDEDTGGENGDEDTGGGADGTPIDQATRDFIASPTAIGQRSAIQTAHNDEATKLGTKISDAGFSIDNEGSGVIDRHAEFARHPDSMTVNYNNLRKHLRDNPDATSVPNDKWDSVFGDEGYLQLETGEDGTKTLTAHPRLKEELDQLHKDSDNIIKEGLSPTAEETAEHTRFLLENKMTQEHLNSLTPKQIRDEFKKVHKNISDRNVSNHLKGIPDKDELLADMAEAHGRKGDAKYLESLKQKHKYTSIQDLVKEHKAMEKEKEEYLHEQEKNQTISKVLNMDKLPEEGIDKLDAMDRLREVAKIMNDNSRRVDEGGKPVLDHNAMAHLKDLMGDATDKGDLTKEEVEQIGREANQMGESFFDEDHRAELNAENNRQRAHHAEFLDHVEGEESLQRRGHDLDHSKAHELHHYSTNDDGTVGERTGSSHSRRNEDGSIEHLDGSERAESLDHAAEGKDGNPREAQHPPKLLGLDKDGQIAQKEHFELMKAGASRPLEEGEMSRFKDLEKEYSALADPKYKAQLLGAQRHKISGEDGAETMTNMGIAEEDQDEAAASSCRPPAGAMPTGPDKAWNPDTHRWCDKEYLESIKGSLGPGEGSYHPDGLHAGAVDKDGNPLAHLDQDADGNIQAVMVTPTGVHKVNPSSGGMRTADGGHVSTADMLGHHLQGHAGGKVNKDTMNNMGFNHSEHHTGEGQKRGDWDPKVLTDFQETPGMRMAKPVLGKLGRMLQRNKEREKGKPNNTAIDRQQARRDTPDSPLRDLLGKIGTYTKEGLKDTAEELPNWAGGDLARKTDRYQDKQVRRAMEAARKRQEAADKLDARINRVREEDDNK